MPIIGDDYTTGDGLDLGVSLVLLEIPNEAWIKQVLISAFNTLTIEENWNDDYGDITAEQATRVLSLTLQTLIFDYEPPPLTPIGTIAMWPSNTMPDGWLLCDGSSYLRTDYPELSIILPNGGTWGGSATQLQVPDFEARSPMQPTYSTLDNVGKIAGVASVTLTTPQIPAHTHAFERRTTNGAGATFSAFPGQTALATDGITKSTGGGGGHENVHPVLGVNFIIYAGV